MSTWESSRKMKPNEEMCFRMGYEQGKTDTIHALETKEVETDFVKNELLTVDHLRKRNKPVWCRVDNCSWIPDGGYWCLCNEGVIVAPSGQMFKCEAIQHWKLYDHRPEVQQ